MVNSISSSFGSQAAPTAPDSVDPQLVVTFDVAGVLQTAGGSAHSDLLSLALDFADKGHSVYVVTDGSLSLAKKILTDGMDELGRRRSISLSHVLPKSDLKLHNIRPDVAFDDRGFDYLPEGRARQAEFIVSHIRNTISVFQPSKRDNNAVVSLAKIRQAFNLRGQDSGAGVPERQRSFG